MDAGGETASENGIVDEAIGFEKQAIDDQYESPVVIAIIREDYDAASTLRRAYIDVLAELLISRSNPSPLYSRIDELEMNHANFLVRKMIEKKFDDERIGKVLAKIHCDLYDVVQFRNLVMTEAFLLSCTNENINLYCAIIPKDLFDFDLEYVHLLINCGPEPRSRKMQFVHVLVENICDYQKSKLGRDFLEKLCCSETIDEDFVDTLDSLLLAYPKSHIKVILKYGFHSIAKTKYGRDITANLFANSHPKVISLLNSEEIDVDKRYCNGNTPLHIAAKYYAATNIQLLLERGANPNARNNEQDTPLSLALKEHGHYICIKLLLFGGADPMSAGEQFDDTFFGFNRVTTANHYGMNVIKLLISQLAVCEAVGLSIEKFVKMLPTLSTGELEMRYLEECRRQLDAFKTHENRFTILTILSERPEILARYISEEQLQMISRLTCHAEISNSYYLKLFRHRVKEITRMSLYRNRAIQATCNFIGIQDSNHLVVRKIVSYFTVNDLVIFNAKFQKMLKNVNLGHRNKL